MRSGFASSLMMSKAACFYSLTSEFMHVILRLSLLRFVEFIVRIYMSGAIQSGVTMVSIGENKQAHTFYQQGKTASYIAEIIFVTTGFCFVI